MLAAGGCVSTEVAAVGLQPTVSAAPPQGVDPAARSDDSPASPTSPAHPASKGAVETPAPQTNARPKLQGPLAVKSKAAKPAAVSQERAPEQGLIHALQSRLRTPPTPASGLLSIAAARPPATGAANPQVQPCLVGDITFARRVADSAADREARAACFADRMKQAPSSRVTGV